MLARVRAVAGASALLVVLAGCGNDSASPTTTTARTAALCAARDDIESSIKELTLSRWFFGSGTETALRLENGTSGLQTALSKLDDDLQVVKGAASSQLQPQVSAFQDSVDEVETAISNLDTNGIVGIDTATKTAIKAESTLIKALSAVKCA